MKNEKKKNIRIAGIVLSILLLVGIAYLIISFKDKNSLTLEESKWIDANKYNVIDIAVINDLPILSYNGSGLFYDYTDYITDKYGLKFNIVPYKLDNKLDSKLEYNYRLEVASNVSEDDINLLKDNMVLITSSNLEYSDVSEITNLKLGIASNDKSIISNYLDSDTNEFIEYDTYTELKREIIKSNMDLENAKDSSIDGIIVPKLLFTKEIIENDYVIAYHFNDLNKYYVIKTNGSKELNSILKKGFSIWQNSFYEESYNSNLLNNYFTLKKVSETDQKKLQSKKYVYGFVDYGIYNNLYKNKISGFNELILKDFNKFSSLSIKYTKYNSISNLLKSYNTNEIDFMMNISSNDNYNSNTYITNGALEKDLVIISGIGNTDTIDNIYSLRGKEILTIKDSYLEKYLISNGAKIKSYNNLKDLATDFSDNDIALLELDNYNYYKTSAFKDAKINYFYNSNDKYNYVINKTPENGVFIPLFNFYLNYNSTNRLISHKYQDIAYKNINISYILVLIIIGLLIYVVVDFSNHVKVLVKRIKKNRQVHLSKEDKIKYIDQLTSLKNRAYLNSRIESWDSSEIYPQAVIIIDLNNISYINDNYGREEGDKVITEAANIFIQYQLHNSEIIRTDGNEFLIYLVGYNEKQVISYLRKLNKELKGLSHGFGAASGYSIISDAIKTFDDAVNEATLDMKNNKEDIDY